MTAPLSHPLLAAPTTGDWMHDRLDEARGVLADTTQHPESLVILAARVVVGQTGDASECADAIDLLRLLDRRPLHAIAAAAFPKGGAV
jgi:hypothetical protein